MRKPVFDISTENPYQFLKSDILPHSSLRNKKLHINIIGLY